MDHNKKIITGLIYFMTAAPPPQAVYMYKPVNIWPTIYMAMVIKMVGICRMIEMIIPDKRLLPV